MKNVLVTGASRGIGKAIAEAFAGEGFQVYMTCKSNGSLLEEYAAKLTADYHTPCHAYTVDMGNSDAVRQLFEALPPLDCVVNNAGISVVALLTDTTDSQWDEILTTNLSSVFYTSRAAIPGMLKKGEGCIINISSVWGTVGASMEVAYSATKGGVNSFTKALAKELAPSRIRVNAIACGVIDTEMNAHLSTEDRQALTDEIPADRFGTPEEVASLVIQLVNAPQYLTGQILTIDGGWY